MYTYVEFDSTMIDELVNFLTSEQWRFHGQEYPKEESIRENVADGYYHKDGNKTFWILEGEIKVGLIRIFDLDDPICLFDLRLKEMARGKGLGKHALQWLCNYVFDSFPQMIRIEGHTRSDNYAMRKTFFNSGFVKEAYHRKAWRQNGELLDSVGYAMTREDWEDNTRTEVEDNFPY